jgi:hypothetical protein
LIFTNLSAGTTAPLAGLAVLLALSIATIQSFIGQKVGSDHPVHVFLTRRIRRSHFRLFVRIPDLLNDSYCGAVPLYLHWIIAHFKSHAIFWSERLLNPVVNSVHVAFFAVIAFYTSLGGDRLSNLAGPAACLFALTPQFYHALSARNFGLSSRGTGLLLLTAFFFAAYAIENQHNIALCWICLTASSWLIWGFSTFAQQALCLLSVLLAILTGRWVPLAGAILGVTLFITLHPKYSLGYLRHTFLFIRAYAKELAPIYILQRRESIWRDLTWDIWHRFRIYSLAQALRYAYENSVVVVVFLNPLVVVCCWSALRGVDLGRGIYGFSVSVALCGVVAALLTSFRHTRFFGEPERYVEAVSSWATLYGTHVLLQSGGIALLYIVAAMFLIVDVSQLSASNILVRFVGDRAPEIKHIERAIQRQWGTAARVCSNNEHFTKMLMQNDWKYAYCFAAGPPYCGMSLSQAFGRFPVLRREACERIVTEYRINACLLDRNEYDAIFLDAPPELESMKVAYESDRFRLIVLEWMPASISPA